MCKLLCALTHRLYHLASLVPSKPGMQQLAVDISLAALLGKDVYSFGELLQHPIVRALQCAAGVQMHSCMTSTDMLLMCGCLVAHSRSPASVALPQPLWLSMSLPCCKLTAASIHPARAVSDCFAKVRRCWHAQLGLKLQLCGCWAGAESGRDTAQDTDCVAADQVQSLEGTQYDWLLQLLDTFHRGDMAGYDALCQKHADVLNAMPALVEHERLLKEKITIMCLLELIFRCRKPPGCKSCPGVGMAVRSCRLLVDGYCGLADRAGLECACGQQGVLQGSKTSTMCSVVAWLHIAWLHTGNAHTLHSVW